MAEVNALSATAYALAASLACVVTFLSVPRLIRSFSARGMVGIDQNKFDKREIAEMGGVAVVSGFFAGSIVFLAFDSFSDLRFIGDLPLYMAALIACLGAAFVGAIDDLFDLRQRVKAMLPILFALPLGFMVADQTITLPGRTVLSLGWLMIPIVAFMISAGANAANMLEGYNGLGAGLGLIMATALALLALHTGRPEALLLLAPYQGATIAFLWYNRFPARIFPGDTFTLFSGATIVAAAILVDLKEIGALLFIPMILEFFLKARRHFSAPNYGVPAPDGTLTHSGPLASLTHAVVRAGARTERSVVWWLWGVEMLIAMVVVLAIVF